MLEKYLLRLIFSDNIYSSLYSYSVVLIVSVHMFFYAKFQGDIFKL